METNAVLSTLSFPMYRHAEGSTTNCDFIDTKTSRDQTVAGKIKHHASSTVVCENAPGVAA